jgi:hypothetical protein
MYIFYYINILQTYIFGALHFAGPCTSEQLAHPLARACVRAHGSMLGLLPFTEIGACIYPPPQAAC